MRFDVYTSFSRHDFSFGFSFFVFPVEENAYRMKRRLASFHAFYGDEKKASPSLPFVTFTLDAAYTSANKRKAELSLYDVSQ